MSVRMRHTSSHTKNRRSHHALKHQNILTDEKGNKRLPHRLDEATGMYRGKQIVPAKVVKAEAKDHKKRVDAHKHEDHEGGAKMPEIKVESKVTKTSTKPEKGKRSSKDKAA